jgi:adenylosuccinate synthase
MISGYCPIVEPTHKIKDRIKYQKKLGTTARGIGPAYSSFYARDAILFRDLFIDFDRVFETLQDNFFELQEILARENNDTSPNSIWKKDFRDFAKYLQNITDVVKHLKPFLLEDEDILQNLYTEGKNILLEGAQATGLNIYSNNYPDVTSSAPTIGGALNSTGLNHRQIDEVIGVIKAYKTKVGSGSFPSQIFDGQEKILAEIGCEYGATTGRPRKCGWLDLDEVSLAVRQNGVDHICIVKTDVMSHPGVNNPQYYYQNKTLQLPKINDVCLEDEGFKELLSTVKKNTGVNLVSFTTGPKRGEIVWMNQES